MDHAAASPQDPSDARCAPALLEQLRTHLRTRHSFAMHLSQAGYDIRTVRELPGHADVNTTMIYTQVLNKGGRGIPSLLDAL